MRATAVIILIALFVFSLVSHQIIGRLPAKLWHKPRFFWGVAAAIIIIYLLLSAALKYEVGDVMLFAGAGNALRHKIDFYWVDTNHTQYPFFPFLIFFHAVANWWEEQIHLVTFSFHLKSLLTLAVISLMTLIAKADLKLGRKQALLFLTHPILALVVYFHGQVDVLLLAFFLWGAQVLERNRPISGTILGTLLYSASVATKTWSIIFLPWLMSQLRNWQRIILMLGTAGFLLTNVYVYTRWVYGSSIRSVLPAVLKAGGPIGDWGLGLLLSPWREQLSSYGLIIFGVAFGLLYVAILKQNRKLWTAIYLIVLAAYVSLLNWGVQYLMWVLPLLYLSQSTRLQFCVPFFWIGSMYVLLSYGNVAWGSTVVPVWLLKAGGLILWTLIVYEIYKQFSTFRSNLPKRC